MASLTDALASMKNKNTQTTPVVNPRYQVQYINYSYLEESAYNFYPMSEIEELADAIELAGGILQPLLVRRKAPGQRYEIIAGHRRWTAAKKLVEQGRTQYAMIPCHVQDGDEMIARINLIVTNAQREKTAFVKMKEVVELEQLLQELRELAQDAVSGMSARRRKDDGEVCKTVRSTVSSYLYKHTKRSPMIIPMVTRL